MDMSKDTSGPLEADKSWCSDNSGGSAGEDLVRDLLSHVAEQWPLVAKVLITTLYYKLKGLGKERTDCKSVGTDHTLPWT